MLKADAIIQARVGSNRLPYKVGKKILNLFLIEWVIVRLKKSKKIRKIILATTKKKQDEFLIKIAKKHKIFIYRGSEKNVLNRIYSAAKFYKSDLIIRVCADNPFIDPKEVDFLIKKFNYKKKVYHYGFNHQDRLNTSYADGFGAEIIKFNTLEKLNKIVKKQNQKEHVTQYIWDNLKNFKVLALKAPKKLAYPNLKFDIDTNKDLKIIKSLVSKGNISINTPANKIIQLKLKFLN